MQCEKAFQLGSYQVFVDEHMVVLNDEKVAAQPKVMELLQVLVTRYPQVVSRNELIELVWHGNEAVGEKALTNTIWQLRQLFANPKAPLDIVETIRKKGYKLTLAPSPLVQSAEQIASELTVNKNKLVSGWAMFTLIFGLLAYAVWSHFNTHSESQAAEQIDEITKMPGSELRPSPSPKGDKLAFIWQQGQQSQLYLKDLTHPNVPITQLTFSDKRPWKAVWSPDQQYLYFAQKNALSCDIVRLSLADLEQVILTPCPVDSGYNYIAISPDGKTLAFNGKAPLASQDGIYLLDLTKVDASPERLSCDVGCELRDRDMAFSPDGQYLAITQRKSTSEERLSLYHLGKKQFQVLDSSHADIVGMSFHPSGQYLVYGAQTADKRRGYIMDLEAKSQTKLSPRGFSYPQFDDEGNLYYQKRRENYFIASFTTQSDVISMPSPVIESHYSNQYPTFSHQHQKLAFLSNESGQYELWLADLDGSNREQITQLQRNLRYPMWSMQGEKLLVVSSDESDGNDKLYVFDYASKQLKRLDLRFGKIGRPFWHGNGQDIVIRQKTEKGFKLFKLHPDTLHLSQLTQKPARYGQFISDEVLLFVNNKGLWRQQGSNVELLLAQTKFNTRYAWYANQESVFYKHLGSDFNYIHAFNLTTGDDKKLLRLPKASFSKSAPFVYDAPSQTLLFTQSLTPQSDINRLSSAK
ncbi:hypothetical protein CWB72_18200 [Pseudoalteromonas phenolica]|uniref:winged helix-turn-helix domain-containing protein n=1 Tax=Pseudoalteromonas phenolica TaxID=161398 RepID=UPI00110AC7F2|nr:winged helix-turn-helix domain-containing protein [Pseudoalteromonas phenolica]TMN86811.1 hypothetical protein CWB72_18200 [Pseudoalteromonas phenolica]